MRAAARAARWLTGAAMTGVFFFAMMVNTLVIAQGVAGPIHVVEGESMAPGLMPSDGVILAPVEPGSLQPGQVVVFYEPLDPSVQVVHRIVEVESRKGRTWLVTKGDGNPEADPFPVPEANVTGRVAVRIPSIGGFLGFIQSLPGYLVTVILPMLVAAAYVFREALLDRMVAVGRLSLLFSFDLIPG